MQSALFAAFHPPPQQVSVFAQLDEQPDQDLITEIAKSTNEINQPGGTFANGTNSTFPMEQGTK